MRSLDDAESRRLIILVRETADGRRKKASNLLHIHKKTDKIFVCEQVAAHVSRLPSAVSRGSTTHFTENLLRTTPHKPFPVMP